MGFILENVLNVINKGFKWDSRHSCICPLEGSKKQTNAAENKRPQGHMFDQITWIYSFFDL